MAFEQRDNSGALFKNDRREKDTHPTHQGTCRIDGKDYFISAWIKESQKDGSRFFSLAFKPKLAKDIKGAVVHKEDAQQETDDIPF